MRRDSGGLGHGVFLGLPTAILRRALGDVVGVPKGEVHVSICRMLCSRPLWERVCWGVALKSTPLGLNALRRTRQLYRSCCALCSALLFV